MRYLVHEKNGIKVAELCDPSVVVKNAQEFIELFVHLQIEKVALYKRNLIDGFLDLRTGIAGEFLQNLDKCRMYLGIIGDFYKIRSKSLIEFIQDCNIGNTVIFKSNIEEVVEIFTAV
jgi:hypothetical protein